jgi:DNA-binding transcriptional MerR regulator
MQLNLLQEDLFSTAIEAPKKPPQKKPKATSAKTPESPAAPAVEPLALIAPAPAPKAITAEPPKPAVVQATAPQPAQPDQSEEMLAEDEKAPNAFKTISEVADFLGLPQHVLRFWESRFSQIKPLKMRGGRRYYRPDDIEVLSTIKHLLYKQGYTINGAKKAFSQGKNALIQNVHMQEMTDAPLAQTAQTKVVTEKQKVQLAAIRQELFALRETLRPYTQPSA